MYRFLHVLALVLVLVLALTACSSEMTEGKFEEVTGTYVFPSSTDYLIGVLPAPEPVVLSERNGIAVALAVEGSELPFDVADLTDTTLVSTTGQVYTVSLVMEMGCWPSVLYSTDDAWTHVARIPLCGDGTDNPGVEGINGVVLLFYVDDAFTQPAGMNIPLGDTLYFTSLP